MNSILRGVVIFVLSVIFSAAFMSGVYYGAFAKVTSEKSLKPGLIEIFMKTYNSSDEQMKDMNSYLLEQCKNSNYAEVPASKQLSERIIVKCSDLSPGAYKKVSYLISDAAFTSFYEKKYDCTLLECLKTNPLYFISRQANEYFSKMSFIMLMLAFSCLAVLFFIMKFSIEKLLVTTGVLIVPFAAARYIMVKTIPASATLDLSYILLPAIDFALSCFLAILLIGIAVMLFYKNKDIKSRKKKR